MTAFSTVVERGIGMIFNVQRCSVHDGPGIRTTVFLKGCPLACSWCHNPEGIDDAPVLMISEERCLGCRACVEACPVETGGAAPAGEAWDRELCTRCGSCVDVCPADAREIAGREISVGELIDEIERDRVFFDASGGGVTFSGGEPLAQPEFLIECLRKCGGRGLHTAVDTCGLAPQRALLEIARLADLVLYDLKHMDPERHRTETGVENRLILGNLLAMSGTDVEIWIRLPLIPGFNDDLANIERTGEFLESLPRRHPVIVLPYHNIALGKRMRLQEPVGESPLRVPGVETLDAVVGALAKHRLDVTVGVRP
jgi:pyruvate formate lyase activating enzyme